MSNWMLVLSRLKSGGQRWDRTATPAFSGPAHANPGYEILLQPDGPIYFAGDHASHIVARQEGAALSSRRGSCTVWPPLCRV